MKNSDIKKLERLHKLIQKSIAIFDELSYDEKFLYSSNQMFLGSALNRAESLTSNYLAELED